MANSTERLAAPRYPKPPITCRKCGTPHHNPIYCPECKRATPHFVVIKGGVK